MCVTGKLSWFPPLAALALACAPEPGGGDAGASGDVPAQCTGAEYIAFDAASHANQDLRVQAYVDLLVLLNEAQANPSLASERFSAAEALYLNTASFAEKVQGRSDDHLTGRPNVGQGLHETILAGFAAGKAASTALEVNLAKQAVDKTLIDFFFLSVHHEMLLGARDKWDEGYGYFGSGPRNAEGDLRGLAQVAKKRDDANGTQLGPSIFNGLIDGSCELANILDEKNIEQIDPAEHATLWDIIEEIDLSLQKVLAYSAGHEAFAMAALQEDLFADPSNLAIAEEMHIKLAELVPYFRPLERIMNDKGGESLTRASGIRTEIDAALADDSDAWLQRFDAEGVLEAIEAEYAIDVVQ